MPQARRAAVALTDLKVKNIEPDPAGEYIQGDKLVPGFGVRVRSSGAMSYVVMKRLPGRTKPTRITLGRVGDLGLGDARQKARDAIAATRQGVQVNFEKRQQRRRARQTEMDTGYPPGTFGDTAERYIRTECMALTRRRDVESVIRRRLLPAWDQQPLDELRRRDLTALLDPIVATGRTQAAHKVREVAIRIINWAIDRGDIEINYLASPSRGRRRTGIIRRTRRDRVLSHDEIRAIWQACDHPEIGSPFRDIVRLLLVLGQRRREVAAMEWPELDVPVLGPKLISSTQAGELTTLSRRTLADLARAGRFPQWVQVSEGRVGYPESAVLEWIAARIAERDGEAVAPPRQPLTALVEPGTAIAVIAAAAQQSLRTAGGGLWVIPANRYKTGIEHAVPLPALAVDIIGAMPRVCDRFVFSTEPGTCFSGFSKAKALLDRVSGTSDWRLHDLRRTVRTNLSGLGVAPDTAERVLGHVIGGIRGVYDRYAYLEEKRDALDRWAARLRSIVVPPPANVIELRAGIGP